MEKLTVLTLLLVSLACYVQAQNPSHRQPPRLLGHPLEQRKRIDPRCAGRYGLFPIAEDCTSYLVCRRGKATVRKCPDGFRFDSYKYCTPEEADCGRRVLKQSEDDFPCPRSYGIFPLPSDCHKYVVCQEGSGRVKTCPDEQVFQQFVGCVESDQCLPMYQSKKQEFATENLCHTLPETGPCRGSFTRYFYNILTGQCESFIYGGCGGTYNRFETLESCQEVCGDTRHDTTDVTEDPSNDILNILKI